MIVAGSIIVMRGRIWSLMLGGERYFVGGVTLSFGIYFLFLLLIKKYKEKK
jgi:hypothetical protein